MYNQWKKIG